MKLCQNRVVSNFSMKSDRRLALSRRGKSSWVGTFRTSARNMRSLSFTKQNAPRSPKTPMRLMSKPASWSFIASSIQTSRERNACRTPAGQRCYGIASRAPFDFDAGDPKVRVDVSVLRFGRFPDGLIFRGRIGRSSWRDCGGAVF